MVSDTQVDKNIGFRAGPTNDVDFFYGLTPSLHGGTCDSKVFLRNGGLS
jgi:hypothetical protein